VEGRSHTGGRKLFSFCCRMIYEKFMVTSGPRRGTASRRRNLAFELLKRLGKERKKNVFKRKGAEKGRAFADFHVKSAWTGSPMLFLGGMGQ